MPPETPKTKTVEVKPVETPKTKTAETKIAPVVVPNKAAPALIPASRSAPAVNVVKTTAVAPTVNVAKPPVVTAVAAPAVRPVTVPSTAAAVVSTTVGQVRIVTGPTISAPRIPTPTVAVIRR